MTDENEESNNSSSPLGKPLENLEESLKKLEDYFSCSKSPNSDICVDINNLKDASRNLEVFFPEFYKFKEIFSTFLDTYNELEISRDFNSKLCEKQQNSDEYQDTLTEFRNSLRQVIEGLTSENILTYNLSWPRRYLYEKACHGKLQGCKKGFIYKAFENYNKFDKQDKKSLEKQWKQLDKAFKEFYEIIPASPCLRTMKSEEKKEEKSLGERSFNVINSLLRTFFFGGTAKNLLKCWEKYEDILYFAEEKYRDHCLHLFYDFLIGCVILEGLIHRIKHYWECYTGRNIEIEEVYIRIMRRWLIASLFHDIGYTAQSLKNVSHKIEKEFFAKVPGFDITELEFRQKPSEEQIEDFCTSLARILSEDEFSFGSPSLRDGGKNEDSSYPVYHTTVNLLTNQLEKMDHGVMSALFVLLASRIDLHELTLDVNPNSKRRSHKYLREKFKKEREKMEQDIEVAALSIAIHNMRQADVEGITIDFRSHPITFLLMLCDDLHEWDREPEWKRKEETITNVYGFNVFRRLDDPKNLFKREVRYDGKTEDETLFNFLFRYMVAQSRKEGYSKAELNKFKNILSDEIENEFKNNKKNESDIEKNAKKIY